MGGVGGGSSLSITITVLQFLRKRTEWRLFHLILQNQLLKATFGPNSKKNLKNCELDPKLYFSNDYKINSEH